MTAYLTGKKLGTQQWYEKRNRPLTGCTVLHTAESVMDSVGPDTGAEAVAEFIRTRTTPGSYHDLVDSDSWIPLVDLRHGAFHDGTGSNNWALSLSFACRTTDWRTMSAEKRRGFLRQGARAFLAQQAYRRSIGAPLTELRLISKAQSDRGESGFTYHGYRDPGRRSDPGVAMPNLFPFDEFIAECRAVMAGTPSPQEDTLSAAEVKQIVDPIRGDIGFIRDQIRGDVGFIRDQIVAQIAGLQQAVVTLAEAATSGRDDLTADELRQAVAQAIQDAGAALRAAEAAAPPA